VITIGSVTGNDNTVGGGGVYPIADLRNLEGLKNGGRRVSSAVASGLMNHPLSRVHGQPQPIAMMDGYNFNGAKGYKDTKLALMMFANALHDRYHRHTGISFSSIYPGCIADSPLFREKVPRANSPLLSSHFCVWIVTLPKLNLTVCPLPDSPATLVPEVLPSVYEVHHRRVCE
jgi:NAD(P)-dependent dehydrogenase (short-subunit alcohol dehydrogenase family)